MLLRDPEFINGNVPVQQHQHQQQSQQNQTSWADGPAVDTNSLSVVCRDGRLVNQIEDLTFALQQEENHNCIEELKSQLELDLSSTVTNNVYDNSPDEGLFDDDDEDQSYTSSNVSSRDEDEDDKIYNPSISDDSCSDSRIVRPIPRGIPNPNYPGFQHLAYTLQEYTIVTPHTCDLNDDFEEGYMEKLKRDEELANELNNNNNLEAGGLSIADETSADDISPQSAFYPEDLVELKREIYELIQKPIADTVENITEVVNNVIRRIVEQHDVHSDIWNVSPESRDRLRALIGMSLQIICDGDNNDEPKGVQVINKGIDDAYMSNVTEKLLESDSELLKMESETVDGEVDINFNKTVVEDMNLQKIDITTKDTSTEFPTKKSCPIKKYPAKKSNEKKCKELTGEFDVYNIETAMPSIDLDAIENHLKAAREEERRRRNDREEIRRRLATGTEHEEFYERPGRKPSLQSRLQSGMNLQICFMNETASDTESPSDVELNNAPQPPLASRKSTPRSKHLKQSVHTGSANKHERPSNLPRPSTLSLNGSRRSPTDVTSKLNFFECQARLQTEARMALAQAKEVARLQMEAERLRQNKSPITEMLRYSLQKAGIDLLGDRRRVSRQMLTDVNVAQLQIIVNELHTQIERLNEVLMELLIARDELHMGQDSMLVDIEDLTRHLSAKDMNNKNSEAGKKNAEKIQSEEKQANHQFRVSLISSSMTK